MRLYRVVVATAALIAASLTGVGTTHAVAPADCVPFNAVTAGDDVVCLTPEPQPRAVEGGFVVHWLFTPSAGNDTYYFGGRPQGWQAPPFLNPDQPEVEWSDRLVTVGVPDEDPSDAGDDTFRFDDARGPRPATVVMPDFRDGQVLINAKSEHVILTDGNDNVGNPRTGCANWPNAVSLDTGAGDDVATCTNVTTLDMGEGLDSANVTGVAGTLLGGDESSAPTLAAAAEPGEGDSLRAPGARLQTVSEFERVVAPTASIPSCSRVVMNNVRSTRAVTFRVVKDGVERRYTVPAGIRHVHTYKRPATRQIVVRAAGRTLATRAC